MAKEGSDTPIADIYGMLLLLSFLFTLGATLLLNDELSNNWGFKLFGDAPAPQSWHITQYRDLTKSYNPSAPYVDIRTKDLDEWKKARNKTGEVNGNSFPVKNFEWPAGYKVNESPVDPSKENNWESAQPAASDDPKTAKSKQDLLEQFNLLINSAVKEATPAPEAPKEEPKKDDAAPKADAPAEKKPDAPAEKKPDAPAEEKKPDAPAGEKKADAPAEKKDEVKKEEAK